MNQHIKTIAIWIIIFILLYIVNIVTLPMISQSLQETIITVISKPVEFDGIRIYTMDGSTYEIGDTLSENYFELKATYKILYMQRGERKIIMSIIERKS